MHWAHHAAQKLSENNTSQVCASGITPSGDFHIGHIREILTAEMIHRACLDIGLESKYIFIVDSMDPLRRVYDFLSPSYEKYIGTPLAFIPAPDKNGEPSKNGKNYAEYFLNPFLESLKKIGVFPEVIMNHQVYADGRFAEKIDAAIIKKEHIREIIENISGRELSTDWFPYSPIGSDGSMDGVKVTGYEKPYVYWTDRLGIEGKSNITKAEGKLPWRIDWAARWGIHAITSEPAGKDHGSSGGSYDTGIPICRLLGSEPPKKMVYEWIQLKGMGPMSSSKGVTIGPVEALDLVPPQILRYVIARSKVNRHIDFDTGATLFETADEYERLLLEMTTDEIDGMTRRQKIAKETNIGALNLSQINRGENPQESFGGVSFRHLSLLAQIKSKYEDVWKSLNNSGHIDNKPNKILIERLERMRNWIDGPHFPENSKIVIHKTITAEAVENINSNQIEFIVLFRKKINDCAWNEKEIGNLIRSISKKSGISAKECYASLYWLMLGKHNGPRIASIISEVGIDHMTSLIDSSF